MNQPTFKKPLRSLPEAQVFLNKVAALTAAGNVSPAQGAPLAIEDQILLEFIQMLTFEAADSRNYTELEFEIIGNRLGMLLGMKRTRDGLWLLSSGNQTGLGLFRSLASLLRNVECVSLNEELTPTADPNCATPRSFPLGIERQSRPK